MASGHVMQATVFTGGIVESNPTGEMSERRGSGPVGIILVPGNNTAMPRRLAKKLVMPEAHGTAKQLRRGNEKSGIPEQIMEARGDAPSAEGVKENATWIRRLVDMVFVKELAAFVRGIHQPFELATQDLDLLVAQNTYAGQVSVVAKEGDLLGSEPIAVRIMRLDCGGCARCRAEQGSDGPVMFREIVEHCCFPEKAVSRGPD